ncbi:MAG: anthranilate synthase component I family protein [Acidimicrobiia bacterium]
MSETPGSGSGLLLPLLAGVPADVDVAVVRQGRQWVVGVGADAVVVTGGTDAFSDLDGLPAGWWAGVQSYDLGRSVERITPRRPDDLGVPDVVLARFGTRLRIDGTSWTVEGDKTAATGTLARLASRASGRRGSFRRGEGCERWSSSLSQDEFEAGVRAVVALVEAGECYQVNLTRRLTCAEPADPVALFGALTVHNPAPHAALVRIGGTAVVSASPERFLRRRGAVVETRPIKGTAVAAGTLRASTKDRAENVMICDLARNDLGRVCDFGSVRVPELCALEAHPGLWHLVSTVTGRLSPGVGLGALARATFPPASVTGAPKPRVLDVIEDLEPVRRGVYCGAVGWIDADRHHADLAVAIRTFLVTPSATHLGVGAGITADSSPAAEWAETNLKASRLLAAAGLAGRRSPALRAAT